MEKISQTVTVGEMQFGGLFILQEDNMLVVMDRPPDWVIDPQGVKVYIKHMFVPEKEVPCPKCKAMGKHGVVVLKDNRLIVCCRSCNEFVWCKID